MSAASIRAIVHASELLTGAGIRKADGRHPQEQQLGRIKDGALVYSTRKARGREIPDRVLWVGETKKLPTKFKKAKKRDLKGKLSVIPGLVDAHTHLVFAGDRSDEFAMRCGGATYQEIADQGGGIVRSVQATRAAKPAVLLELGRARIREAMSYGVRTIEIKSGYGLSTEAELKQLEVISKLKTEFPELKIQSTFLGAHAFPKDMKRDEYMRELLEVMLPRVAKGQLADACDVFVDEGYYTLEEGRQILKKAQSLRLKIKIHADELCNTESAGLAAKMGALSADHLLKISDAGITALSRSKTTVAVLLPGTALYLKASHAPARKLIDAGACVAVSTDFNPGTCMTLNLPAVMTIAALYLGMSRAELFAAVTYNAAKALDFHETRGTLEPGMEAAFTVLPYERFEELYYRFAAPGW